MEGLFGAARLSGARGTGLGIRSQCPALLCCPEVTAGGAQGTGPCQEGSEKCLRCG